KKKSHFESQSQYFGKKSQFDYFPKSFSPRWHVPFSISAVTASAASSSSRFPARPQSQDALQLTCAPHDAGLHGQCGIWSPGGAAPHTPTTAAAAPQSHLLLLLLFRACSCPGLPSLATAVARRESILLNS